MNVFYGLFKRFKSSDSDDDNSHKEVNFCPISSRSASFNGFRITGTAQANASSHPDGANQPNPENMNSEYFNEDNNIPFLPNKSLNGVSLDTKREVSSIPRAGYNQNWIYPSVMQFYNALFMKNKVNDDANYMDEAVKAHNEVNELSWSKILKWEKLHERECKNPKLRRFVGKYNKMNPKSVFKRLFTRFDKPFDRHDWYIDRCGKEVRYILDYYDDPKSNNYSQVYIDVRPAMDSLANVYDRIRYTLLTLFKYLQ